MMISMHCQLHNAWKQSGGMCGRKYSNVVHRQGDAADVVKGTLKTNTEQEAVTHRELEECELRRLPFPSSCRESALTNPRAAALTSSSGKYLYFCTSKASAFVLEPALAL